MFCKTDCLSRVARSSYIAEDIFDLVFVNYDDMTMCTIHQFTYLVFVHNVYLSSVFSWK